MQQDTRPHWRNAGLQSGRRPRAAKVEKKLGVTQRSYAAQAEEPGHWAAELAMGPARVGTLKEEVDHRQAGSKREGVP